jgi:catechol 2,3-dioxygenase-like lactoylglutathione lyase family enzyme
MAVNLGSRVVPSLLVNDMRRTIEFYIDKLGFTQTGYYPIESDPDWTELRRDGVAIHFYTEPPHVTKVAPAFSGMIYFHPENVDALADEWRGKVDFEWGPEVTDHGMHEFGIRDPNGYLLAFTEPAQVDNGAPHRRNRANAATE